MSKLALVWIVSKSAQPVGISTVAVNAVSPWFYSSGPPWCDKLAIKVTQFKQWYGRWSPTSTCARHRVLRYCSTCPAMPWPLRPYPHPYTAHLMILMANGIKLCLPHITIILYADSRPIHPIPAALTFFSKNLPYAIFTSSFSISVNSNPEKILSWGLPYALNPHALSLL